MNILFTICGRAGSKGLKNKNLKEMNGIPIVYYTLAAIKGYMSRHPENTSLVAVNTDSKSLRDVIQKQSVLQVSFIDRKSELADDIVPKVDVIKDTVLACGDSCPDVVIDLDITSPMRRIEDIENIVAKYSKGIYDLVFSVVKSRRSPYFNMVENKPDGFYRKVCASNYTARQQAPKCYEMNASIYAYNPKFLLGNIEKTILDYNCGIVLMQDYLVLDIDSEDDFQMMEYLHQFYCSNDYGLKEVFETAKSF